MLKVRVVGWSVGWIRRVEPEGILWTERRRARGRARATDGHAATGTRATPWCTTAEKDGRPAPPFLLTFYTSLPILISTLYMRAAATGTAVRAAPGSLGHRLDDDAAGADQGGLRVTRIARAQSLAEPRPASRRRAGARRRAARLPGAPDRGEDPHRDERGLGAPNGTHRDGRRGTDEGSGARQPPRRRDRYARAGCAAVRALATARAALHRRRRAHARAGAGRQHRHLLRHRRHAPAPAPRRARARPPRRLRARAADGRVRQLRLPRLPRLSRWRAHALGRGRLQHLDTQPRHEYRRADSREPRHRELFLHARRARGRGASHPARRRGRTGSEPRRR